jgi:protein TonB
MRRRRQKNNLLPKMIGIAVIINAILLPILARLGVFKAKKGNAVMNVKLVELPPEKKTVHKPAPPKKQAKAKTTTHRVATHAASAHLSRPNPNAPKVVTSTAPGGTGASVDSGSGAAGVVPQPPPSTGNGQGGNGQQQATAPPPATTPPPAAPPTTPAPPPVTTPPPAPPHEPVLVQAEPLDQPKPQIPEDLQASFTSDATESCLILFSIHSDGSATPKLVSGTGNSSLDDLAMQYAHKWTFRPATKDGAPVDSYLRLRMEFDVSG